MNTYESQIVKVPADAQTIYEAFADMRNIERVRDLIPPDKVQELESGEDFIRMKVDGLGQKIVIRIVDRIVNDTLKFGIDNLPIQGNFWMQVKQVAPSDSRLKLTLKAELPMMIAMMAGKKIQQGMDEAAQMIAKMPFNTWR